MRSDPTRDAVKEAAKRGCVVVHPEPNQLFIDIDSAEQHAAFLRAWEVFVTEEIGARYVERPSPSLAPDHFHIVVTLARPVTNMHERIFQAALGSDPLRELLSWKQHNAGDPNAVVFFESFAFVASPAPPDAPPRTAVVTDEEVAF